ncbi:MAG TPA: hypothetical protein VL284_21370 [Thermoanaerobaculia bacterium]|nr:hypothetical protein [Thermoanaerobaculia bacterium]
MKQAAIGLKSKTGRAIAVAIAEPMEFLVREEVMLCDRSTKQPYHDVMEMPWSESVIAVKPAIVTIEQIAARELRRLIKEIESRGYEVACIGVVGPADRKLERIGNPHIRAHAAEGVLFRAVIEKAAKANGRESHAFVDPASEVTEAQKKKIAEMKRVAGPPWTADEKAAAMAAIALLR